MSYLPTGWFDRPTEELARELLGRLMVREAPGRRRVARIVETEAYVEGDRANHALLGPSMRNRSMFGPPGTLYVYRIHQVHCANIVTGGGEAVLLRSAEPIEGIVGDPRGPGRLCRVFDLTRRDDGSNLLDGPLRVARGGRLPVEVDRGTRVGIRRDAARPLRFGVRGSRWLSRPIRRAPRRRPTG